MEATPLLTADTSGTMQTTGRVRRLFCLIYALAPETLAPFLPPDARLALHAHKAWLSTTFMQFSAFRPAALPALAGTRFMCLTHSTRTILPFPDGRPRAAHLLLKTYVDSRSVGTLGRALSGLNVKTRPIEFVTDGSAWRITVRDGEDVAFNAMIRGSMLGSELPRAARFESVHAALQFFQEPAFAAGWDATSGLLRILPWNTTGESVQTGTGDTRSHALLEHLGLRHPRADFVISTKESHCQSGTRGVDLSLSAA